MLVIWGQSQQMFHLGRNMEESPWRRLPDILRETCHQRSQMINLRLSPKHLHVVSDAQTSTRLLLTCPLHQTQKSFTGGRMTQTLLCHKQPGKWLLSNISFQRDYSNQKSSATKCPLESLPTGSDHPTLAIETQRHLPKRALWCDHSAKWHITTWGKEATDEPAESFWQTYVFSNTEYGGGGLFGFFNYLILFFLHIWLCRVLAAARGIFHLCCDM